MHSKNLFITILSREWFLLSLLCAFFTALTATLSKLLLRYKDEIFVGWIRFIISLPIFFFVVVAKKSQMELSVEFWKTVAILLPFELIAFLLYFRALKLSPLSLTFPFLGLTPVFTILTSSFFLKETLPLSGITGVGFVSLGAYLLNADTIKGGFLLPIKNIYKEKGSIIMVVVAFIYGITSALGKKAIVLSNPAIFPLIYYGLFFLIFTPIMFVTRERGKKKTKSDGEKTSSNLKIIFLYILIGLVFSLSIIFHFKAISLVNVSYMISVKRLSLVISVLFGYFVFREKNIMPRLTGSIIMLIGVILISVKS